MVSALLIAALLAQTPGGDAPRLDFDPVQLDSASLAWDVREVGSGGHVPAPGCYIPKEDCIGMARERAAEREENAALRANYASKATWTVVFGALGAGLLMGLLLGLTLQPKAN